VRFRITNLLAVSTMAAVSLLPLIAPSYKWALGLPAFSCLVCIYGTMRILSYNGSRLFWAAFLAGAATYLSAVVLISMYFSSEGSIGRQMIWDDYVGVPLWHLVHGDEAFTRNRWGLLNEDYRSFLMWVHVEIAIILSAIAALTAVVARALSRPAK
jgi:hypothetical protein